MVTSCSWLGSEIGATCSCCCPSLPRSSDKSSSSDDGSSTATRTTWFGEKDPNKETIDIPASFRLKTNYWILLVKFLFWAFIVASFIFGWYDDPHPYFFPAYLSNWTMFFSILYLTFSLGTSIGATGNNLAVKCTWALYIITSLNGISEVILFWPMEYVKDDPDLSYFVIMAHGISLAVVLIDGLLVNRIPVRLAHYILALVFGVLYIIWTLVQSFVPVDNPHKADDEYESLYWALDWDNDPWRTVVVTVLYLFVAMPVFTFLLWGLSLLVGRRYVVVVIAEEEEDVEAVTNGEDNESPQLHGDDVSKKPTIVSSDDDKNPLSKKSGDSSEEEEEEEEVQQEHEQNERGNDHDIENPSTVADTTDDDQNQRENDGRNDDDHHHNDANGDNNQKIYDDEDDNNKNTDDDDDDDDNYNKIDEDGDGGDGGVDKDEPHLVIR